jgi:hypothetical protein
MNTGKLSEKVTPYGGLTAVKCNCAREDRTFMVTIKQLSYSTCHGY